MQTHSDLDAALFRWKTGDISLEKLKYCIQFLNKQQPYELKAQETMFQTPEKFFSQYLEEGHIFPKPGLPVRLKDGSLKYVSVITPKYADYLQPIHSSDTRWYACGHIYSSDMDCVMDIMAVLDAEGNIIAGWEKPTRYYTAKEQQINAVVLEDVKRDRELNERIRSKLTKQKVIKAGESYARK